jgi:hypothetical protein
MLSVKLSRPAYAVCRLVSSAHSFQQNFQDLKSAGNSLSPIERFFFSLVLTNTRNAAVAPAGQRQT